MSRNRSSSPRRARRSRAAGRRAEPRSRGIRVTSRRPAPSRGPRAAVTEGNKGGIVKKVILLSILGVVLLAFAAEWHASRTGMVRVRASESQIYIHGTPVCVFRDGDGIVARVGNCGPGADTD